MSQATGNMDAQEKEVKALSKDIDPTENNISDSLAEATTVPLEDDELGGTVSEDDIKNKNSR